MIMKKVSNCFRVLSDQGEAATASNLSEYTICNVRSVFNKSDFSSRHNDTHLLDRSKFDLLLDRFIVDRGRPDFGFTMQIETELCKTKALLCAIHPYKKCFAMLRHLQ